VNREAEVAGVAANGGDHVEVHFLPPEHHKSLKSSLTTRSSYRSVQKRHGIRAGKRPGARRRDRRQRRGSQHIEWFSGHRHCGALPDRGPTEHGAGVNCNLLADVLLLQRFTVLYHGAVCLPRSARLPNCQSESPAISPSNQSGNPGGLLRCWDCCFFHSEDYYCSSYGLAHGSLHQIIATLKDFR